MFFSLINLIRLIFILIFVAPFFLINKEKAIYFFFNFAGPSFIKLGQLLSVRADLVGKQVALTLTKFQDCLKPFSHKKVINILHQEFGDDFDKIFKEFNFTPVASASIAQVHKARLHNDLEVAVKILRPNIHKTMMRDISTLRLLTKICYLFSKFLAKTFKDVGDLLDQTARYELDLLQGVECVFCWVKSGWLE